MRQPLPPGEVGRGRPGEGERSGELRAKSGEPKAKKTEVELVLSQGFHQRHFFWLSALDSPLSTFLPSPGPERPTSPGGRG